MGRKFRVPKVRQDAAVPETVYRFLLWRDPPRLREDAELAAWIFFEWSRHQATWVLIAADAVAEWVQAYPGTRPAAWWEWTAPELRRLMGGSYTPIPGAGRSHPTGIPYIDDWERDPPLVESEPAYLDRLRLWLPDERVRVPASAFAAQPFSYDRTVRLEQRPDAEDDGHDDDDAA
jgi:hypothetical protein